MRCSKEGKGGTQSFVCAPRGRRPRPGGTFASIPDSPIRGSKSKQRAQLWEHGNGGDKTDSRQQQLEAKGKTKAHINTICLNLHGCARTKGEAESEVLGEGKRVAVRTGVQSTTDRTISFGTSKLQVNEEREPEGKKKIRTPAALRERWVERGDDDGRGAPRTAPNS